MDTHSRMDEVEAVYDARIRGACLVTARSRSRMHLHAGCWVTACAYEPARLLVAFPKEFEAAEMVQQSGSFAVSLVAEDQAELLAAMMDGRHSLDQLGREHFLLTPGGCPVLRDGVGYVDCQLIEAMDLGDVLLAVGDVRAAAVLHPDKHNLTVNTIQAGVEAGPALLPFSGFEDGGHDLPLAPAAGADGEALERVYARRQWGLFAVTAGLDPDPPQQVSGWAIQCGHSPPRMAVAVPRGVPTEMGIRRSGTFRLSLLAEDHLPWALALSAAGGMPADKDAPASGRAASGTPIVADGIAHFACRVDGEFNAAADCAGFYGTVEAFGWGRREARPLCQDQLSAALEAAALRRIGR